MSVTLASPNYRTGGFGYVAYAAQTVPLVDNYNVADGSDVDPDVQDSVSTLMGACPVPSWTVQDNLVPAEGAGYHRDWGQGLMRKECSFRQPVQVQDGAFLAKAIRAVNYTGGKDGLPLFTTEMGWTDENAWRQQGLDCLINTMTLNYQEMAFVTADLDIWATAVLNTSEMPESYPSYSPPEDVLRWEQLHWTATLDSVNYDLRTLLQSARLSVSNNLSREGHRKMLLDENGAELAVSRTCREIVPGMEKLQLSYTVYDLPSGFNPNNPADWGTVVLLAQNSGATKTLRVTLDHHYASRIQAAQVGPREHLTYNMDISAMGIAIAAA